MLKPFYKENSLEVGLDEAGRGCLIGRVYAAAVFWDPSLESPLINDSKKLTKDKREKAYRYIIDNAIGYGISYCDEHEIDKHNILQCSLKAMHKAIDNSNLLPSNILVDGNYFKFYRDYTDDLVSHVCITSGDSQYYSIAAASILAKVSHDHYINDLCDEHPDLDKYNLRSNMGYGSAEHIAAINTHGISKFHRKTFGICKEYS